MSIKPYTYCIIHEPTGRFYVGVRWANVKLARAFVDDHFYWGSSRHLKMTRQLNPEEWSKHLLCEYDSADLAIAAEPWLIEAYFGHPLCMNKSKGGLHWRGCTADVLQRRRERIRTRPRSAIPAPTPNRVFAKRKLSDEAVRDIRRQYALATPLEPLATKYGVSYSLISLVASRQRYSDVV